MNKLHPLNFPIVVHSHEVNKHPFRPKKYNKEFFGPKVSYFSAIGALMY